MAQTMSTNRVQPGDFFDLEVLPELFRQMPAVFPEFAWRKVRKGWEATACPPMFAVRPERIMCMERAPYCITVVDDEPMTWTAYVNGGSVPKGAQFVAIVRSIAQMVGVDASCLDAKNLTPAQLAEIERRRQEQQAQARAWKLEQDKKSAQESEKAIDAAVTLIRKAVMHGDRAPAERYFKRRGRRIERMPGGRLPSAVLYTPDVGIKGQMIGAVVAVIQDDTGRLVACQRAFIENTGQPIDVKFGSKTQRKAALGRPVGGACVLGEPRPGEPIVLCEGVETGVAVHELTGWCVVACISAGGLERVSLDLLRGLHAASQSVFIVAGDLDRSLRGQRATVLAADRIRHGMGVEVAELLPSHKWAGELVGVDELPLDEGKSVDWEDVINEQGPKRAINPFAVACTYATVVLTDPAPFAEAVEEPQGPDDDAPGHGGGDDGGFDGPGDQGPEDPSPGGYRFKPYAPVFPPHQLDAAHEVLLAHHGPERIGRAGGGLHALCISGELYLWRDGFWQKLGGKPTEILRRQVRRHFKNHCKAKATKEVPPRYHFVPAQLSENQVGTITSAAVDEITIVHPADDFTARFWHHPNVFDRGSDGLEVGLDDVAWGRVVTDPAQYGLPEADKVIPTREGNFNTQKWRDQTVLELLDPTPMLFNLGRIEATLPIDQAVEALRVGGLAGLEEYSRELCPDWIAFLEQSFAHDDPECTPAVIRELHKYLGNLISGKMGHHSANIGWFVGPSGSGKSVLGRLIEQLLGKVNTVSSTMTKLTDQFHLSSWIGKLYAMFPDMDIGRSDKRALVEILKLISTDDPLSVDRKYIPEVPNIRLGVRIGIFTNNMPSIPDPTLALVRRSIVFEMRHAIKVQDQDPDLADKLGSPRSLSGILLLCLIGIKHIDQDKGFIQPKWYQGLLDDLKGQSSEYAEMIDEYIVTDAGADAHATEQDLYALYKKAGELNGQMHNPKRSAKLSQLKTSLTGYGWARQEGVVEGQKALLGIRITDAGYELVHGPSGASAGGHDEFIAYTT